VGQEAESRGETVDVVLHTMRLPQSIGPDAILSRLETLAKKTLAENGLAAEEVAGAKVSLADGSELTAGMIVWVSDTTTTPEGCRCRRIQCDVRKSRGRKVLVPGGDGGKTV
jgi:hypothetical protein